MTSNPQPDGKLHRRPDAFPHCIAMFTRWYKFCLGTESENTFTLMGVVAYCDKR